MVPSATPARSAISETREWKNPFSAMTSIAASSMRLYLSEASEGGLVAGSGERFTGQIGECTWIYKVTQLQILKRSDRRIVNSRMRRTIPETSEKPCHDDYIWLSLQAAARRKSCSTQENRTAGRTRNRVCRAGKSAIRLELRRRKSL